MRINKYLSYLGICSRRDADRLIEQHRVSVDHEAASMGQQVDENNIICIDGIEISHHKNTDILLAFNKPVGVVCTTRDEHAPDNIIDYIGYSQRIYPVGRLDKESQGLILLTNNGELTDKLLRSVNEHEKEYMVEVHKRIDDDFVKSMAAGVYLKELDRTTRPCSVEKVDTKTFKIVLTQGLNRQIRRMCAVFGYQVTKLTRIRIMNIYLGELKTGEYRKISGKEKSVLYEKLHMEN